MEWSRPSTPGRPDSGWHRQIRGSIGARSRSSSARAVLPAMARPNPSSQDTASALRSLSAPQYLAEQAYRLFLQSHDVRADLLERPERLRLVEVAREADLVASPDAVSVKPCIGRVRQHLAA